MSFQTQPNKNAINTKPSRITLDIMLALFILFMVYYWVFTPLPQIAQDWLSSTNSINTGLPNSDEIILIGSPEFTVRLMALVVNLLFSAPIFYGFWLLRKLLKLYAQGLLFTKAHVEIFKHVAFSFIAYGICLFLSEPIMALALTAFNNNGDKLIVAGFGSSNLFPILTGIVMLPLVHVMQQAEKMADEQQYTV
ncbi:DUF2975 domain-containing protein [Bartonella sp. HY329]|uniref:DUF2975 domain-containing protein n=1 Tax=unclassified Bartonella TaxID=2645622 RepID=UPI0021C71D54|nr:MULTISPECIES: DUF2975 domain-containing protein [unclassified Bartonella]UXM94598.1 DUF2975 domain-containing protein [Bartonella sp. HY329]UXN08921.1 DUF2975 domain-containing protein [Bartonella sp. HY328]